ncbi:MAG TPA: SRPBCC family protein [Acidimicrobiales bacterium]|nr:SRPBCC family protein [Acidimicrobiales bacterium]
MTTHETSIDVERPVRTVYNQWTQFESFPHFMGGVEKITQIDDTHTHWVTKVGGVTREFDATVTEQTPDQRIAWTTDGGTSHAGVVTFHRIDDGRTRVMLQMDVEPDGLVEKAGEAVGVVGHQLKSDLERFKQFIESQPTETGAWRGEVGQSATS